MDYSTYTKEQLIPMLADLENNKSKFPNDIQLEIDQMIIKTKKRIKEIKDKDIKNKKTKDK